MLFNIMIIYLNRIINYLRGLRNFKEAIWLIYSQIVLTALNPVKLILEHLKQSATPSEFQLFLINIFTSFQLAIVTSDNWKSQHHRTHYRYFATVIEKLIVKYHWQGSIDVFVVFKICFILASLLLS